MERLILFTGKGGVGKTSLAAAHAWASAGEGKRTLLASMDAAHNLSDLFAAPPSPEPREVAPHLEICEVDANRVREDDFRHISRTLGDMLGDAEGDELVDVPGLDPLFFLLKVHQLTSGYDRVILDLAPTGETLSLLQLPELLAWWMEHIFPLERVAVRVLAPVSERLWQITMPDRQAMNDVEALHAELLAVQQLLKDPARSSVRLVTQPERMIVAETKRAAMYLNLLGYPVDHVFVNGIFPADEVGPFFADWVAMQGRHLADLDATFGHLPMTRIHRLPTDLAGPDAVAHLAGLAVGPDAFALALDLPREAYTATDDGYELAVPLPLAARDDIALSRNGHDLTIGVGAVRRTIPLPTTLAHHDVARARLADGRLTVTFRPAAPAAS